MENPLASNEMPIGPSLFTAFLCILFGANAVAIKISLSGLGAFTTAGLRFGIAGVTILLWAIFKKQSLKANKKQIFQLLILSQLFVIQSSFFYIGLTQTAASQAVIINLMPFVVLIFAHYFIPGERITFKKGVGVSLGFLGVLFLFFDSHQVSSNLRTGDMMIILAAFFLGVQCSLCEKNKFRFYRHPDNLASHGSGCPIFHFIWICLGFTNE